MFGAAAVALYFMYYNFGRVHQTLRVTPAMEAGIADHVWSIEEIVGLLGSTRYSCGFSPSIPLREDATQAFSRLRTISRTEAHSHLRSTRGGDQTMTGSTPRTRVQKR